MDKKEIVTKCRFCPTCNGIACKGEIPGLGGKGTGNSFIRNTEQLKRYKIKMDVIADIESVDTSSQLFDHNVDLPVYLAPVAGINNNFGANMTDLEYSEITVKGCQIANTIAFTGDGVNLDMFTDPVDIVNKYQGVGIPTIKPWIQKGIELRTDYLKDKNILALATDIDSAGLPLLRNSVIPVENKNIEKIKALKNCINVPLIVKGIMSVEGAKKALEAGADAIVVSNHGGRVQDETLSTIEVLEDIVLFVNHRMTVLVDGGFRTGEDIFKALALGADGVLMGRPFAIAAILDKEQGVVNYVDKIKDELKQAMIMTGCSTIQDITRDKIVKVFD